MLLLGTVIQFMDTTHSAKNPEPLSIEDLQKEKLRLEIADINKKWYKRKDYLQILLPTIIAVFSLLYAIASGFFSTKYDQYQLQKERLQLEVQRFEEKKESLLESNEQLTKSNKELSDKLQSEEQVAAQLKSELINRRNEAKALENKLVDLSFQKQEYTEMISQLEADYQNKKKLFAGALEKQYITDFEQKRIIKAKNDTISSLQDQIADLHYEIKIYSENPFIQKNKSIDMKMWVSDRMIQYRNEKIKASTLKQKKLMEQVTSLEKASDTIESRLKTMHIGNQ